MENNQQSPSATVDEKIKDIAQRLAQHVTFDRQEAVVSGNIEVGYTNHNVAELIEEGITEYLHSQQPTVDVDVLWEKWKSATMQVNILGDKRDIVFKIAFEYALQEALRGSYTREELLRNRITELESENVRLIKMIDGE